MRDATKALVAAGAGMLLQAVAKVTVPADSAGPMAQATPGIGGMDPTTAAIFDRILSTSAGIGGWACLCVAITPAIKVILDFALVVIDTKRIKEDAAKLSTEAAAKATAAEERAKHVEARMSSAESEARERVKAAEARAASAEDRAVQAEERMRRLETRMDKTEVRMSANEGRHDAIAASIAPGADGPRTVLLVEDDERISYTVAKLFTEKGFKVTVAPTVSTARELAEHAPEWIILDLVLPDGSGIEVLKHVRDNKITSKIVVVSGNASREIMRQVRALKPERVMTKPFDYPGLATDLAGKKPDAE